MPAPLTPRAYQRSFTGGEVTAEFLGRLDEAAYQNGLATCRNFIVMPHGPAKNRAGFAMVHAVKNSANPTLLVPFKYANLQSFAIEVGAGYFRFHTLGAVLLIQPGAASAWVASTSYAVGALVTNGGTTYYCITANNDAVFTPSKWYAEPATGEYEVPNNYAAADLFSLRYVQSNDVITFTHLNYPPSELKRYSANNWTFSAIVFTSLLNPPTNLGATAADPATSPGPAIQYSYVVTSVKGTDESAPSGGLSNTSTSNTQPTGGAAINSISQANPAVLTTYDTPSFAINDRVYISGVGGMNQANGYWYCKTRTFNTTYNYWTVTFSATSGGAAADGTTWNTYLGGGTIAPAPASGTVSTTGVATCSNNLFDTGATNTISWNAPASGIGDRYYVYKLSNGLYGYIGQTTGTSFVDNNIAPDLSHTPPIQQNLFASAGNYPQAVGYFEQRRCFAGSINDPQKFWATKTATESNLSYAIPSLSNDSITFKIAAREREGIRHIVPMANLILLSEAGEWRVAPADGAVLTPNVSVRQQSQVGSGNSPPVVVNNAMLFASARGGHMRELSYNWQVNGYVTGDISLRAIHLFNGYDIVDMAYMKTPIPVVWAVSTSGNLLGLTYIPEEQVGAWHRHDTVNGIFESVCVIPEGAEDVLYAIVKRTFNGVSTRFVERMASRAETTLANYFFVDNGITQTFANPVTNISGLTWLAGQTVSILGDGAVMPQQVVSNTGTLTLPQPAKVVTIGLPITADWQNLPLPVEGAPGFGKGMPKDVNEVWLQVSSSSSIKAGPGFDKLTEYKQRTTEAYGSAPNLVTDEIHIRVGARWGKTGQTCIRQDNPLPLTIISVTTGFVLGGG